MNSAQVAMELSLCTDFVMLGYFNGKYGTEIVITFKIEQLDQPHIIVSSYIYNIFPCEYVFLLHTKQRIPSRRTIVAENVHGMVCRKIQGVIKTCFYYFCGK